MLIRLWDHLRPATRTADETVGLHNRRISTQTVRNCLREAHLHARRLHQGLELTAVRPRNRLQWENANIRWELACWRSVLFMDESWFQLYRADGRQCVWRHVGDSLLMSMLCAPWWRWGYGMGRHKLRTTNTIAFYRWQFE
jgi:hypothetical protein